MMMQGSIRSLLNQNGEVVAGYRYSTFGETEESFDSITCPWQFSVKRLDAETGFLNFGRRYYLPDLGRWLNPDPQGFEDGPNLYAYVHNNPLTHIDLYGLIDRPKDNNSRFGNWLSSAANFAVDLAIGTTLDLSACITKEHYKNRELEATSTTQNLLQRDVKAWNDLSRKEACFLVGGSFLELVPLSWVLTKATQLGFKIVPRVFKHESFVNKLFIKRNSATLIEKSSENYAKGFSGKKGWELTNPKYQTKRNSSIFIEGREYSGHALDQMQNRGIYPSMVENTIQYGKKTPDPKMGRIRYYDSNNRHTVIINEKNDKVITTLWGER